ncbi:enoyl-CoA hydratase [Effusibacillus pohliae]|uniref:enoyl-CoA hydratase n=1 Tax=Effusibacillus pohliae TaxID=232270 RepID=UPI000378A9E8|nr:enoyl-CoA hydratase [Effusibacillus pohliae]
MNQKYIRVLHEPPVGIITLHRPEVLNALNLQMVDEIVEALERMDRDDSIRAIVLTGNDKAFAAGADISEMADEAAIPMLLKDQFAVWDRIAKIATPLIAAVSGYVLGGGCELMMNCDMVIASETARIGQPEIRLGVMPGAGGTQRLTKAVGKVKAMEMLLTGEPITADEALRYGMVNKVVPVELYLREAIRLAQKIAEQPPVAVRLIKKSVLKALDNPLDEGLDYERNCFYLLFASEDKAEGMRAFAEKRKPNFTGR